MLDMTRAADQGSTAKSLSQINSKTIEQTHTSKYQHWTIVWDAVLDFSDKAHIRMQTLDKAHHFDLENIHCH